MMKPFIHDDFLLDNKFARELYHSYAESQPIIDYHNHLSPQMIAEDYRFGTITELWLGGDHYKWRALRANGCTEEYITGNAPDREKFRAWARTLPKTMRNPLYHWTQLELKRYFGIDDLLCEENADEIYDKCNAMLAQPECPTQREKVVFVCVVMLILIMLLQNAHLLHRFPEELDR